MGAWERTLLSPMGWPLPGGCPSVGGQAEVSPSSPGAVAALSCLLVTAGLDLGHPEPSFKFVVDLLRNLKVIPSFCLFPYM